MFTEQQKEELEKPLNSANVANRTQSGRTFSYVASHHCISEANRIFGYDGWTRRTLDVNEVQNELKQKRDSTESVCYVSYTARVEVEAGGIVRQGCGFGQGIDRDLGQAHESALKEAESDGMKRALMTFGDQFGLALYDKKQERVETKPLPKTPAKPKDRLPLPPNFKATHDTAKTSAIEIFKAKGWENPTEQIADKQLIQSLAAEKGYYWPALVVIASELGCADSLADIVQFIRVGKWEAA